MKHTAPTQNSYHHISFEDLYGSTGDEVQSRYQVSSMD